MTRFLALILACLLILCSERFTAAGTVNRFISKEGKVIITLGGTITSGDAEQVSTIIRNANTGTKFVSGIRLNSPGGDLAEGVRLADIVRTARMVTVVPAGSICASACFVIFAAGEEKYVSNSAQVGVHAASDNGAETASSSAATIAMARIVKDLGVPSGVLGKMVVTPPSEIVWLTANDLRGMGATMTGRPAQTAALPPIGQQIPRTTGPSAAAVSTTPSWDSIVKQATDSSARQNGGTPVYNRICQPEFRLCTTGLSLKGNDGKLMLIRVEEDVSGNIQARELCTFNSFGDVRKCLNWDKKIVRTDMRDASGKWSAVSDN